MGVARRRPGALAGVPPRGRPQDRLHSVRHPVPHDGAYHLRPLAGRCLERAFVLRAPGQAPPHALAVAPLRPAQGVAGGYGRALGRLVAAAVPPIVAGRRAWLLRGRGEPAVAGELVVAVEPRDADGGDRLRGGPRADAGHGLQVLEVGVSLERLGCRGVGPGLGPVVGDDAAGEVPDVALPGGRGPPGRALAGYRVLTSMII